MYLINYRLLQVLDIINGLDGYEKVDKVKFEEDFDSYGKSLSGLELMWTKGGSYSSWSEL